MKALLLLLPVAALCQQPAIPPEKATLEGQIVNAVGGEPLRKVRVSLRMNVGSSPQGPRGGQQPQPPGAPPAAAATVSDLTGKFEFTGLEPGNYQLTARHDGFGNETIGSMLDGRKRDAIVLGPGDHKTGILVKMTPYGVITGRVVDEDGDPIQSLTVATMTYQYTSRGRTLVEGRTASTDDRGEYRIYDVPPGKYVLKFGQRGLRMGRAEDTEYYAAAFYPGVAEAASAAQFEMRPGQQMSGIGATLRRARLATLRGHVVAPAGTNVSVGLMVTSDQGSSSTNTGINDKEGKFEIFAVSPGPVFVTGSYSLNGQRFSAQIPLQVGSSDINGLELRPLAPLDVPGQLRIDGESTLKPSQVQVTLQAPGRGGSESAKDDGTFVLHSMNPDVYRVSVNRLQMLYLKSTHWGSADITDGELDLTAGVPPRTELTVVLGADGAQIEGVVSNDKDPAEGAVVTLIPTGSHKSAPFHKSATADSAGHFTIRSIAPGAYRLIAWDKVNVNAVMYDPDFLRPYETAGENVVVEGGQKKTVGLKLTVNQSPAQ